MHVLGEDQLLCIVERDFAFTQKFRNNPGDVAAALCHARRYFAHQTDGPAAVDQANVKSSKVVA